MADFSTYEGRQAYRDANPGAIVDASGAYYPSTGQTVSASSGGGGGGGAAPTVQASSSLSNGINSLLGAISSGNKQAFDEAVRQFNATFGLDQNKFNEAIRQFNENEAISVAGLTGYYTPPGATGLQPGSFVRNAAGTVGKIQPNGTIMAFPTPQDYLAAGGKPDWSGITTISDAQFSSGASGTPITTQGTPTMAREQQTYEQQMGAINAAAALQANPFRQQQVIGQLGRVLGGQGVAGFSAPNTVQGVGTAGGTGPNTGLAYMQQMIDDIRNPGANQASVNSVLEGIPTPNKINSADFLRSAPSTQSMILQGMQEKYGLDPTDSLQQIKNTLPSFQAPTTFGTIRG